MKKKRIAIFASGSGSNAMKLLAHFENSNIAEISLLLTNNKNAGILEKSKDLVPQIVIDNAQAAEGLFLSDLMQKHHIDYIVLAGYLRKIPNELIQKYPKEIINIHPALLPKYGGKGMYGMNVHRAVKENGETESGITVHLVDSIYDNGVVLLQEKTPILPSDTPEEIQKKVLKIEHQFFSVAVERYIQSQMGV